MNTNILEKIKQLLMIHDIELDNIKNHDDNPPVFYDPRKVVILSKRLQQFSIISLIIINLISLTEIGRMQRIVSSFFYNNPNYEGLSWLITIFVGIIAVVFQSFIYFFTFRAMSWILLILMDMEFSSRDQINTTT